MNFVFCEGKVKFSLNVSEIFSFKNGGNKCLKFKAVFFILDKILNHSIQLDPIV